MATPPTFVSTTATAVNTTTSPKTTASIAVVNGDVLVAWAVAENDQIPSPYTIDVTTASGSTSAWTQRVAHSTAVAGGPGDICYRRGLTATATATGNITVTFTRTTGSTAPAMGGYVKVWRGSAGVGNANVGTNNVAANSAPTIAVTASANSGLDFFDADWNASAGTVTFTATSGSLVTDVSNQTGAGSTYCIFSSHVVDCGTAGSKSMGMSAPALQRWVCGVIEILGSGAVAAKGIPLFGMRRKFFTRRINR